MRNAHGHWWGQLDLDFSHVKGQTILAKARHEGPLRVQRPFREPNGGCQVYILNPPGGAVGGDELQLRAHLQPGSRVLLTAPGASKLYRGQRQSQQRQTFVVEPGAHLEWLPQETIVYDGAHAQLSTHVELLAGASFVGWDITCLGRPAAHERFGAGLFQQRLELHSAGRLVWAEASHFAGADHALCAAWGLAGRPVFGSMVAYPCDAEALTLARATLPSRDPLIAEQGWLAATLAENTLVCRDLGYSTAEARAAFSEVWRVLRPHQFGCVAVPPRIWNT